MAAPTLEPLSQVTSGCDLGLGRFGQIPEHAEGITDWRPILWISTDEAGLTLLVFEGGNEFHASPDTMVWVRREPGEGWWDTPAERGRQSAQREAARRAAAESAEVEAEGEPF